VAPPVGTLRVGRYFLALIVALGLLYSIVFWPGSRHTPKLGLDLVGGTQVIFTAKTQSGKVPSKSNMNEAKQIIEARVNGSGVTESTVVVEGTDRIVVSIPGNNATDVSKLGAAAQLNFRGLVMPAALLTPTAAGSSASTAPGSTAPQPSSSAVVPSTAATSPATKNGARQRPLTGPARVAPTPTPTPTPKAAASSAASAPPATASAPAAPVARTANPFRSLTFTIPTSEDAFNKLPAADQQQLQTALAGLDCTSTQTEKDDPKTYFLACDTNSNATAQLAYLLGPVIVPGHEIKTAAAQAPNVSNGSTQWTVSLSLKSTGQAAWGDYTTKHNIGGSSNSTGGSTQCGVSTGTPCADFVAFTLDGVAISTPVNEGAINGGSTQISGGSASPFTQSSANSLANKLKYGALPLSFTPQQSQKVSATLGTSQLKAGLLAGGIGLALVVVYSLLYYRALGLVTIASLLVSGALTYGALVMLGTQIGFTLSLAGIAGFIVAVGITADSFVVFFERMKDEVHEGRSARVAIPRAWVRARRTILSADTVSFLAAATLYYFAAGDVKGFAFTLGLSTVLDLVVVFLFTHPLVSLLSRRKSFGSARFSGLNAVREGGIAPSAPEPAARNRTKPAHPGATSAAKPGASSVALLDREDDLPGADADPVTDALPDVVEPEPAEDGDDGTAAAPEPRRHTVPEPGSAAERAAERRARMRAQAEKKGRS
jgi:preprotein translocase subunit SecD